MEALRENSYTVDDIYDLPDGERAELIDGKIYYMAPPSTKHQRLVRKFTYEIERYIRQHEGDCEVFPAPFAVFLNENNKNYIEPDISVICDKNKINDDGCHGAPDWIIEIVLPSSRSMDYYRKLLKYRSAGVREYWVVDEEKKNITIYNFESDEMKEYKFDENVPVGIYKDFFIKLTNSDQKD